MNLPPPEPIADLDELSRQVYRHFQRNRGKVDLEKRQKLSEYIRKFHLECGTLSPAVEKALKIFGDGEDYVFLWSAHQPNLFPYVGVVRKIVLMEAVKRVINEQFGKKVVCLFAIADNVFPDKWVLKASLPRIDAAEGKTVLRMPAEEKNQFVIDGYISHPYRISTIEKPDESVFEKWNETLERWLADSIEMNFKVLRKVGFRRFWMVKKTGRDRFQKIFDELKNLMEECWRRCKNFSDFNAFFLSKLVNEHWGYDTLFARLSEFNPLMKEKCVEFLSDGERCNGMFRHVDSRELGQIWVAPVWYHCECGGKVPLYLKEKKNETLKGECTNCGRRFSFSIPEMLTKKDLLEKTSFRAPALIYAFSSVFNPNMYVGGTGGWGNYYGTIFSFSSEKNFDLHPIAVWNPVDRYVGVGQLNAALYAEIRAFAKETKKRNLIFSSKFSILDYLLNMGFSEVSEQMLSHLLSKRNLREEVHMKTILDDIFSDDVNFKEIKERVH